MRRWGFLWFGAAVMAAATASDEAIEQSRALRRQLTAQQASAVAEKTPFEQEAALSSLIEQIRLLQWPSTPAADNLLAPAAADPQSLPASETKPAEPNPQPAPTPEETALTLLTAEVNAPYPMELGDMLYRKGHFELAGRYYQIALKAADKSDAAVYPWLLFQAANCLRHTDLPQATALYQELMRLYPNSVWATAAQARDKMLTWLTVNHDKLKARDALRNDQP